MSELKATTVYDAYWKANSVGEGTGILVYIKSEADKVIALLKDKANYNEYAYKIRSKELVDTCRFYEKELRHHKYKRCLAMAKYCDASMAYFGEFYDDASKWMVGHYYKWRGRWYEFAKKFKEGV